MGSPTGRLTRRPLLRDRIAVDFCVTCGKMPDITAARFLFARLSAALCAIRWGTLPREVFLGDSMVRLERGLLFG